MRWPARTLEQRFWAHVDRRGESECWPWTGAVNQYGYGHFRMDRGPHQVVRAHRLALTLVQGPAPEGKPYALHAIACTTRRCCNAQAHLRWGDQSENMDDMYARYRKEAKVLTLPETPHTVALLAAVAAVRPVDRTIPGDGLRWLRETKAYPAGLPGAPWWYDDVEAGEIVRVRDGARYPIDQVPPLCVAGVIDLHAVDRWIAGQPELRESEIRARAFGG